MAILKYDQVAAPDFSGVSSILRGASSAFNSAGESARQFGLDLEKIRGDNAEYLLRTRLAELTPEQYNSAGRTFMSNPENQELLKRLAPDRYLSVQEASGDTKNKLYTENLDTSTNSLTNLRNKLSLADGGEVLSTSEGQALWDSLDPKVRADILKSDPSYSRLNPSYTTNMDPVGLTLNEQKLVPGKKEVATTKVPDPSWKGDDPFSLVRLMESNNDNTKVALEPNGTRSYGKYQFNSGATLPEFFQYVLNKEDDSSPLKRVLKRAIDTGVDWDSDLGASAWKAIVSNPNLSPTLSKYMDEYATLNYKTRPEEGLTPEAKKLIESMPAGIQLLTSTTVQHGPTGGINILNKAAEESATPEEFVEKVYEGRTKRVPKAVMQSVLDRYAKEKDIINSGGLYKTTTTVKETPTVTQQVSEYLTGESLLEPNGFTTPANKILTKVISNQQSNEAKARAQTAKLGIDPVSYTASLEANKGKSFVERTDSSIDNILNILGSKDEGIKTNEVRTKVLDTFKYALNKGFTPELAEGLILTALEKNTYGWRALFGENADPTKAREIFNKISPAQLDSALQNTVTQLTASKSITDNITQLVNEAKASQQNYNNYIQLGLTDKAKIESNRFYKSLQKLNALMGK